MKGRFGYEDNGCVISFGKAKLEMIDTGTWLLHYYTTAAVYIMRFLCSAKQHILVRHGTEINELILSARMGSLICTTGRLFTSLIL